MLGNLCKYLCQPVPNLIPEGEKPLDSLTKLLVFHLNTKSAIQRIVVAEVVYYWALTQVKHGLLRVVPELIRGEGGRHILQTPTPVKKLQ